jgi:chromosome segregation ATPase
MTSIASIEARAEKATDLDKLAEQILTVSGSAWPIPWDTREEWAATVSKASSRLLALETESNKWERKYLEEIDQFAKRCAKSEATVRALEREIARMKRVVEEVRPILERMMNSQDATRASFREAAKDALAALDGGT